MNIVDNIRDRRQINPLISLLIVIVIALILSVISFSFFWNSDTKNVVQSIQRTNQNFTGTPQVATGIDDDNQLSLAELLFIQDNLEREASSLTPEADFGGQALEKTTIGY